MKSIIMFLLILVAMSSRANTAERKFYFDASLESAGQFGHTKYRFEQVGFSDSNLVIGGGSELIFPLDGLSVGLTARIRSTIGNRPDWSVMVRLQTNLIDPGDPFTDRDWETLVGGQTRDFSYTESDINMNRFHALIEARKLIAARNSMALYLIAGVGYDRISQDALGFEGWQIVLDSDSNRVEHSFESDMLALKYRVTYIMPHVGLSSKLFFGPKIGADFKAAFSPLLVNDKDEHVLRNFIMEAKGSGFGLLTSAAVQYDFDGAPGKKQTFIRLGGEFSYLKADVSATVRWHGNDNFDDFFDDNGQLVINDNTGDVIGGLPHNISSRQYSLNLSFGIRF